MSSILFKVLQLLLIVCTFSTVFSHGHISEILLDDELPVAVPHGNIIEIDDSAQCHVEIQIMKRTAGKCIKIGRTTKACVAGNYVHPFHPDCM